MIKLKNLNKKSVIYTWALSYITVIITTLGICLAIYFRMENVLEKEVNHSNDIFLEQIQQYMDGLINDARTIGIEIALNPYISKATNLEGPFTKEMIPVINECIREIRGYRVANNSIDRIFIYLKNIDKVVNERRYYSSREFYNIFLNNSNTSYDKWIKTIEKYHMGNYVSNISWDIHNNASFDNISYIRSLPFARPDINLASIVVSVNKSKFLSMAKKIESEYKGKVLILDRDNKVIWATKNFDKLPEDITQKKMILQRGLIFSKGNEEKVAVSYISSKLENWKYVLIIPKSIYWEKLQHARKLMYIGAALSIIMESFTVFVLLRKNYQPINNLVSTLGNQLNMNPCAESDEYSYIESIIKKINDEKDEIRIKLMSQRSVLKARFIEKLLKGRLNQGLISESLTSFNISLKSDYFGVILFSIEDFAENIWENGDYNFTEVYKLFQEIIPKIMNELSSNKIQVFITEVDELIGCIINFDENPGIEGSKTMDILAEEICMYIDNFYKIKLTAAVSGVNETINGIATAYNEALEVMEYKEVMGIKEILSYNKIQVELNNDYYYPLEKENQLINCIKLGDFDMVNSVIEDIFNKNFLERKLSRNMARCLMYNLIGTILKTIDDISSVTSEKYTNELNSIEGLINNKCIGKIKHGMLDTLKEFCEHINSQKKGSSSEIKNEVEEYILNNYMDENLCISTIADYFNMHPSYISKLFKLQAKEGILDCINRIRIDKAKEIMKKQRINLDEVAKSVGYSNVRTFTRAFSKIQGITPGKYKEIL